MMKRTQSILACVVSGALSVSGCSTNSAALNQANHTTKLMGLMDKEAAAFRTLMEQLEVSRKDTLTSQRRSMAVFSGAAVLEDQARLSAGDTRSIALRDKLLADADLFAKVSDETKQTPVAYRTQLDKLLVNLPSTTASITEAQTKSAAMGTELTPDVRRAELLAFIQAVKKSLDENEERIKTAKAEADKTQKAAVAETNATAPK
jgi:hypothetical protein